MMTYFDTADTSCYTQCNLGETADNALFHAKPRATVAADHTKPVLITLSGLSQTEWQYYPFSLQG